MNYLIRRRGIVTKNLLTITPEEFNELRAAREGLSELLNIEEKFNIVLENYAEFERVLMNATLQSIVFAANDWSELMEELNKINRILVNLLSTCRVYTDQVPQNLAAAFKENRTPVAVVRDRINEEYDNHLSYRVLEALRNYSQHRSLPLHGFGRGMSLVGRIGVGTFAHYISIKIDTSRLREDPNFKRQVLAELKPRGDYIDVKPLIREYIECFMRIHSVVREIIAGSAAQWDGVFLAAIERYNKTFNEAPTGIAAMAIEDSNTSGAEVPIFEDLIQRRKWLSRKNRIVANLSSHFLTTETEANLNTHANWSL